MTDWQFYAHFGLDRIYLIILVLSSFLIFDLLSIAELLCVHVCLDLGDYSRLR
jgi:hypothetical protein